jgi:beta-lysine 5,6-aminomutase beta subunit
MAGMLIRPYGDTINDGAVQLSFTLPVADSARAREAARQLVLKMGFFGCDITHAEALSDGFTMFIAYARTELGIDPDEVRVDEGPADEQISFDEINSFIESEIGRKVVVVGACTGFDAHTVGIDAIMNMKGYNHHFGLERYPMVEAHNLGAQVANERLIEYAGEVGADAILVSQVVTQKDAHVKNLTGLVELLEAEGLRDSYLLIVGGPRIGQKLARELGFDAGFGKGTYAEQVATFIARKLAA